MSPMYCTDCGREMFADDDGQPTCEHCDDTYDEVPCDHPCDACMGALGRPVRDCDDRLWMMVDGRVVPGCSVCGYPMREDDEGEWVCPRCGTDFGDGTYEGEGRPLRMVELFAGTRSIGKVAEERGWVTWSTDLYPFEEIDVVGDILDLDPAVVTPPWTPDFIWASPPCTYFSVASIGKHWSPNYATTEYPHPHTPKTEEAKLGVKIVEATWAFIDYWLARNPRLLWAIENPMGKLRKLTVMERAPYRTSVTYCAYGDTRRKPTDIWSNFPWAARPMCKNGDPCHVAAPRGSRTPGSTQGHKTVDRSRLPEQLCRELIEAVEGEVGQ